MDSNFTDESRLPLGHPDGARASLSARNDGFISFRDISKWGALATKAEDLKARVFFGRKGSGKTIYLRRKEAYTSGRADLISVRPDYNPIETDAVVRFCQLFEHQRLTSNWALVWRFATFRSLASHILFDQKIRGLLDISEINQLEELVARLELPPLRCALSIYDNLRVLIHSCTSRHSARLLLEDHAWIELDSWLKRIVGRLPPICYFLDAIDDEFARAPLYWMQCQMGLFEHIMRLLRDSDYGGRLHIFACLRDLVLVRVLSGEHAVRHHEDEYIRPLQWNYRAIYQFLDSKLQVLSRKYFVNADEGETRIERWLGLSRIRNYARNVDEPIAQYLLRHTRLLPRDVIDLGNQLCGAIRDGRLDIKNPDREAVFRDIVSRCARDFADEQLVITSSQISSDQMPSGAAEMGYAELYTSLDEFKDGILESLKILIEKIGKDRFPVGSITRRKKWVGENFEGANPFQALWQNGLMGVVEKLRGRKNIVFYGDQRLRGFKLPTTDEYVFHPCLIDAVNIKPEGAEPIVPYLE